MRKQSAFLKGQHPDPELQENTLHNCHLGHKREDAGVWAVQNLRREQQQWLLPGSMETQKCITVDVGDGRALTGH